MLYKAPNDRTFVTDPTPEELESELQGSVTFVLAAGRQWRVV